MVLCPNCGLENLDNAKFCSNCGTPFTGAPSASPAQPQYTPAPPYEQPAGPYKPAPAVFTGNAMAKNIGLGCLIFVVILLFLGLSCTRACFGLRHRSHVHYRY